MLRGELGALLSPEPFEPRGSSFDGAHARFAVLDAPRKRDRGLPRRARPVVGGVGIAAQRGGAGVGLQRILFRFVRGGSRGEEQEGEGRGAHQPSRW